MPELVAKSSSAIAVDDSLTTLIDWVNIEALAGFTVIVNNAGGGSDDDITDVQIDTSDDGGVTVNTDQHADVPAVPVAAGKASMGIFHRDRRVCANTGRLWRRKRYHGGSLPVGRFLGRADMHISRRQGQAW